MRTTSVALAAVLALTTTVLAEPARPRIYYPRHVKRQFGNSTTIITSSESLPSPEETTISTTGTDSTTTKRQSLGDFLSDLLPSDDETSTSATKKTNTKTASDATDSGILVGPTGIVTTSDAETTTTKGGLLDPILTGLLPDPESTTAPSSDEDTTTKKPTTTKKDTTAEDTTAEDPETTAASETTTKGGLLDPILTGLLPDPTTTTKEPTTAKPTTTKAADDTKTTAASETTTKGGLLDPILTGIIPDETTTANVTEPAPTEVPTTTTKGGILPTLLPPADTTTTSAETETAPNTTVPEPTSAPTDVPSSVPTETAPLPTETISSDVPEVPVTNSTAPEEPTLPPTSLTDLPTSVPTTEPTDVPTTNITSPAEPTTAPTDLPTTVSEEPTTAPATTAPATTAPDTTELPAPTTSAPVPTTSVEPEEPVTSLRPTATLTNTDDWLPSTMVGEPTTMSWSPPTGKPTGPSTTKSLPTGIPKVILSDDPDKPAPKGSVAIQMGFKYKLNYEFVAKNTVAAAQIFQYLPMGLAEAGGFDIDQIQITKLVPWDTRDKWGYVTTLVKMYYPESMTDKLQSYMWAPNSALYHHDKSIVEDLMININPKIDLWGNDQSGGSYGESPDDSGNGNGNNDNNDAFGSDNSNKQSGKQMGMTAGIAMGALGLSVMYGAAMFIVARRYKRKRQARHQRTSSIGSSQGSSDMQFTGTGSPALMGGALLSRNMSDYGGMAGGRESHGSGRSGGNNSARTANISAPVAAENSLGWN